MPKRNDKSGVFKINPSKAAARCEKCQVTVEVRCQAELEEFIHEHNPHEQLFLGHITGGEFKSIGGPGKFVIRSKKSRV